MKPTDSDSDLDKVEEQDVFETLHPLHAFLPDIRLLLAPNTSEDGMSSGLFGTRLPTPPPMDVAEPAESHENLNLSLLELAKQGDLEQLQDRLWNGANPDQQDEKGHTPLMLALQYEHKPIVEMLLSRKAKPKSAPGILKYIPVLSGIARNLLKVSFPMNVNRVDAKGRNAAMYAAKVGNLEAFELLQYASNPNQKDSKGRTALHIAAGQGHVDIVRNLLWDKRVQVQMKDNQGMNAAMHAAQSGRLSAFDALQYDCHPNEQDGKGRTSLMLAAEQGHEAIARRLLNDERLNLWVKDQQGLTAAIYAVKNNHPGIWQPILRRDPHWRDEQGRTPLMLAAQYGREDVVDFLLRERNTVLNNTDHRSNTAIAYAAENGHSRILERLIQPLILKEEMINTRNDQGQTPLMRAAAKGHNDCLDVLLRHNARVTVKDRQGRDVRHYAADGGNTKGLWKIQQHIQKLRYNL